MRHCKTLAASILQVNTYPTDRGFTAIGTGGDDFAHSMVVAVESVIEERIPEVGLLSLPLHLKNCSIQPDESDSGSFTWTRGSYCLCTYNLTIYFGSTNLC